jgi:hypothetical protein
MLRRSCSVLTATPTKPKRFFLGGPARARREIQLRLEAFNVFNQPYYALPVARVDAADAGQIREIVGTMREMQIWGEVPVLTSGRLGEAALPLSVVGRVRRTPL